VKNIDLRIANIQDVEFYINAPATIKPEEIGVQVEGNKMDVDGDAKIVSILSEVRYVQNPNTDASLLVLRYVNVTSFYIENFHEIFKPKDGHYIFDSGVSQFLVSIILPTIRGILFVKTAGTSLSSCYLPLIRAANITQSP
jgi:hypothetical protein